MANSQKPLETTINGRPRENWGTKIGVILAVAGSAVGLGNFLRFPGQATAYGGGVFMIPYFISLILVGIPICWAEWTMGRYGGARGFNSSPGILSVLWRNPVAKYLGGFAIMVPITIYMYYVYIEVWCITFAWDYATGTMREIAANAGTAANADVAALNGYFLDLVGFAEDGIPGGKILLFTVFTFFVNFALIYMGVTRGIERFSKIAMPALIVCALIVLVRVLTLGTPNLEFPERNVNNALGFMWNPKIEQYGSLWAALANPEIWLAASSQIFFSLSVGFGLILNYASYLRPDDDVALSGLTATATNEFCEICLGGLITIPLVFLFLETRDVDFGSTLSVGFMALPPVFNRMPLGDFFGALWFLMLFIAGITSSLSMLQPGIAFFEEGFNLGRKASTAFLGLIAAAGALLVIYFSKNLVGVDTMDFWMGNFMIFTVAMIQVVVFGWIFGTTRGKQELEHGAEIRIPSVYWILIKYISPLYLIAIFLGFCIYNLPDRIIAIFESEQKNQIILILLFLILLAAFLGVMISLADRRWKHQRAQEEVPL